MLISQQITTNLNMLISQQITKLYQKDVVCIKSNTSKYLTKKRI